MAVTVAHLKAILGLDDSQLTKGLQNARKTLDEFGSGLVDVGKKMSLSITAPIAALGGVSVKIAADFEQSMNVLQATSGASAAQMGVLSEQAKALGNDLLLPGTSATDAGQAMLELSKGGLSLKDTMDGVRSTLQLSAAAQVSNARAAEIVADSLAQFSLRGSEAGTVADLLAGASNAATGSVDQMAQALQQSGAAFSALNVPINEAVTAISLMAAAGIKGSDAGTSLKNMMISLAAPTKEAKAAQAALGFSFFDNAGKMKPMAEISELLRKNLGRLTAQQKVMVAEALGGRDAFRALIVLGKSGAQGFEQMEKAVSKQGSAAKLAAAYNKGLSGAIDGMKSAFQSAAQAGIEPVIKDLTAMARWVGELIASYGKLSPETRRWVTILLAGVAAVGPLLVAIGQMALGLRALLPVFAAVKAAAVAVWAFLGGPLTIVLGLVVAAVILVRKAWAENWFSIQEQTRAVVSTVRQLFEESASYWQNLWQGFTDLFAGNWESAWDRIKNAAVATLKFIGKIFLDPIGTAKELFQKFTANFVIEKQKSAERARATAPVLGPPRPVDMGGTTPRPDFPDAPTTPPKLDLGGDKNDPKKDQSKQLNEAIAAARIKLQLLKDGVADSVIAVVGEYNLINDSRRRELAGLNEEIAGQEKLRMGKQRFKADMQALEDTYRKQKDGVSEVAGSLEELRRSYPGVSDAQLEAMRNMKQSSAGLAEQQAALKDTKHRIAEMEREQALWTGTTGDQRFAAQLLKKSLSELTKEDIELAKRLQEGNIDLDDRKRRYDDVQRKSELLRLSTQNARDALKEAGVEYRTNMDRTGLLSMALKATGVEFNRLGKEAQDAVKEMLRMEIAADAYNRFADNLEGIFSNAFENIHQGFGQFFQSIIQGFDDMLRKMAAQYLASQVAKLFLTVLGNAFGGKDAFAQVLGSVSGRAMGGATFARATLVGENGPELVVPPSGSSVMPNSQTTGMGGAPINVHITIQATDGNSVRRTLPQMEAELATRLRRAAARNT